MKKIYFVFSLMFAFCITSMYADEPLTALDETFANGLPTGWEISKPATNGANWLFCNPENIPMIWSAANNALEGQETPDKTFAFFETFTGSRYKEGHLNTPLIKPTGNYYILSFETASVVRKTSSITGGIEATLHIEVSTDNGETYTTITEDLAKLLNHQQSVPTVMTTMYIDLADYTDTPIKIRFKSTRAVNGGAFLLLDNVKLIEGPENPVLSFVSAKANYTHIPATHASIVDYKLSLLNEGYPVREDDGVLKITTTPGTFTSEKSLPVLRYLDKKTMTISGVLASEIGPMSVGFSAEMLDGSIAPLATNIGINITNTEFAVDNGTMVQGVGMTEKDFSFGNLFELAIDDKIGTFSAAWDKGEAQPFKFRVFKIGRNAEDKINECILIYTSEEFIKPLIEDEEKGKFIEFDLQEVLELEAGEYLITVFQTEATRIELATDGNPDGIMYMASPDGGLSEQREIGYALLRPQIATPRARTFSPANGATEVALDAPVTVEFTLDITGERNGITINNQAVDAEIKDNVLTINHADFEYETSYTVFIPAGAIVDCFEDITWSFKTERAPLEITTLSPADGATNVALTEVVSVTFSAEIEGKLTGIKINGKTVNAEIDGNTLTISHAAFALDTEYTVRIPAGAIDRYNEEITWTFNTGSGNSLETVSSNVKVYPTVSKGSISIDTPSVASVQIADLSGKVLAVYTTEGKESIELDYSNGIYLISVTHEGMVSNYKIVLQK